MSAALAHRGPDDEGFYLSPRAGLAMRRLSVLDVEGGRQPLSGEGGDVWVAFNGEIYNFRTLREELERSGHRFTTATDTETIVHLYEELGPRCVARLRGMFAFAVWDARRSTLLLARDRLGIKPLYYASRDGRLVFASELKAILELPGFDRGLDARAVQHLFTTLTTPADRSVVAGVSKLEPGHVLLATPEGIRTQRYWDLVHAPDRSRSEEEMAEGLREVIGDSVRLHLASDVPLGAFLSGGIDSSVVVAAMAHASDAPVQTFSIGFAESDFDERPYARLVAERFGTRHHERVLEPDVAGILDDLAWHLDEPFGDSSAVPSYVVSKLAAEHVTVVLSGDGGDELFAGYDKYAVESRERRLETLPAALRRLLAGLAAWAPEGTPGRGFLRHMGLSGAERYLDAQTLYRPGELRRLFRPETFARFEGEDPWEEARRILAGSNGDWLSALQYLDLRSYLPLDILTKVDRTSMAHSLEARVPLLDHVVVEYAARIPPELKLRGGTRKHILKRAMRGLLPEAILRRPKRGFAVPLGRWFRGRLAGTLRDLLLSERARRRGLFDMACVESRISAAGNDLDLPLWTLLSFELWCRTFVDRPAPRAPVPRRVRPPLVVDRTGVPA
jgi:asparagine synthase (glutamine-hydrolysing)